MINNQRGHVLWLLLFIFLALANMWYLVSENMTYTRELAPVHEFLMEDLESEIPNNGVVNWANYAKKKEYIIRVARLRPPIWKVDRHRAYLDLLDELETMETQVHPAAANSDTVRAGLGMLKGIDTAAMMKSMEALGQQQAALRLQLLPKYKEKVEKLKTLYQSLT